MRVADFCGKGHVWACPTTLCRELCKITEPIEMPFGIGTHVVPVVKVMGNAGNAGERRSFGSSVKAGHGLPPVTAGIGVWLDGVGQAGTYGAAERMNGRTRLHRCQEGVPINNCVFLDPL